MKLKLPILLLVCAILIASFGAAALSSVSLERSVTAGSVLADTAADVAVKFTAGANYDDVVTENSTTGEVAIDLSQVLTTGAGFNTEALFTIGTATDYVFSITNNTDVGVLVTFDGSDGLAMFDPSAEVTTGTSIAAGGEGKFYFKIDTTGIAKGAVLSGTLSVDKAV